MAKPKASTKKKGGHKIRRRIAAWHDATGDDDAFLDAMVEVTEEREARIDYRLVIRERSQDGYTGNALTIPISRADALVFAAAAAPFSTAEAEKRWSNEKKRRREAAGT
jgi:hypothetical protein